MTALSIRNATVALLCCGLVDCGFSMSPTDSRTGANPVPLFDKMVVMSAANDDGTNPEFPQMIAAAFRNAAARCGIKIKFAYEPLDQQPVGPRRAVRSGMELSIVPHIVFDEKILTYKFDSSYGYFATLIDRSRNLELWKASFETRPGAFWPHKGSVVLATAIADPIFAQMAQDGVLHGCPPAH